MNYLHPAKSLWAFESVVKMMKMHWFHYTAKKGLNSLLSICEIFNLWRYKVSRVSVALLHLSVPLQKKMQQVSVHLLFFLSLLLPRVSLFILHPSQQCSMNTSPRLNVSAISFWSIKELMKPTDCSISGCSHLYFFTFFLDRSSFH